MSQVTLAELLASREQRAIHQRDLLSRYGGVLVSFTLNIPGPVKDSPAIREALRMGMGRLEQQLTGGDAVFLDGGKHMSIVYRQIRELSTGPEGYLCIAAEKAGSAAEGESYAAEKAGSAAEPVDGDPGCLALAVKQAALAVEEGDRLGRLFDIDVLTLEGGISRQQLGAAPRPCLLCGQDAKICARAQRHSLAELYAEIQRIFVEAGISQIESSRSL